MDALYENIRLYCTILGKCGQSEVENWQAEDLDRAFHWADYFKKVVERLKKKRSVAEKVNTKLKEIGHQQGLKVGGEELNFTTFGRSSEYLVQTLLHNPVLPAHLREKINARVNPSLEVTSTDKESLRKKVPAKVRTEAAALLAGKQHRDVHYKDVGSLSKSHDLQHSSVNTTLRGPHTVPIELPANATSLLEYIEKLLSHRQSQNVAMNTVCEKLESFAHVDGGMTIILQSLIEVPVSNAKAQKAILHWLLEKARIDRGRELTSFNTSRSKTHTDSLWQESPVTLAKVSTLHLEFFKEHIKYLTREVDKLETNSTEPVALEELKKLCAFRGETRQMEASETEREKKEKSCLDSEIDVRHSQTFDKILAHFVQLLKANEDVKRVCLSLVKSKAFKHTKEERFARSSTASACTWFRLYCEINETLFSR